MITFQRTPIEYFGYGCFDNSRAAITARNQQYCRYVKGTCVKPRKSEPNIKVGICTVGATVAKNPTIEPVIICPQRFKEEIMFETIRQVYLNDWNNVKWVSEVNLGVGGNIDYVAFELEENNKIKDFLCVEIQAAGTTGSPYYYIQDLKSKGKFETNYSYNINWANEFAKTMMQQAYKKGRIVEHWGRKIVFVIQDVGMKYLRKYNDCSLLNNYDPTAHIDFCTFSLGGSDINSLHLQESSIFSTNIEGIKLILGGAATEEWLTEEEFKLNIFKKALEDGVLNNT